MNGQRSVALYRRLAGLYPKQFREEYRGDLVALFAEQLREEGATRVWLRTTRDLIVTVPAQHLEAKMRRPSAHTVAVIATCFTLTAFVLAIVAGTGPVVGVFLLATVVGLAVATAAWRASRPVEGLEGAFSRRWHVVLAVGAVLLAGVIVFVNSPPYDDGEVPEAAWALMMLTTVTSVVLITIGLTLGITKRVTRRARAS